MVDRGPTRLSITNWLFMHSYCMQSRKLMVFMKVVAELGTKQMNAYLKPSPRTEPGQKPFLGAAGGTRTCGFSHHMQGTSCRLDNAQLSLGPRPSADRFWHGSDIHLDERSGNETTTTELPVRSL